MKYGYLIKTIAAVLVFITAGMFMGCGGSLETNKRLDENIEINSENTKLIYYVDEEFDLTRTYVRLSYTIGNGEVGTVFEMYQLSSNTLDLTIRVSGFNSKTVDESVMVTVKLSGGGFIGTATCTFYISVVEKSSNI